MLLASWKIRNKLAIAVCLLVVPLILLAWLFIQQSFKDIDFAAKERAGIVYLDGAWPALRAFAGAAAGVATPAPTGDLAALGQAHDAALDIGAAGRDLREIVARLGAKPAAADSAPAIAAARALVTKIADGSNLTLDPDLDSYYVMDVATIKLPEAAERIAALAALARAHKARATLGDDDKAALMIELGLFRAAASGAAASLDSAIKGNASGTVSKSLSPPAASFARAAERFSTEAMAVTVALRDDAKRPHADLAALTARAGEALAATDALWKASARELDLLLVARIDGFKTRLSTMLGLSAVIVVLALLFVWMIARSVTTPLIGMQRALQALAAGDLTVALPAKGRGDEIGQMTDMLHALKLSLVEAAALRERQRAQELRAAEDHRAAIEREAAQSRASEARASAERQAALHELAGRFETAVGGIIDTVTATATELDAAAGTLTATAATTQKLSQAVVHASGQMSANVQSVASATEEMSLSVGEISRQVQESSRIAAIAVGQAHKTDARISQMSEAANRIGDVLKLITAIAEQTNLLALNATIEAARAGDAGRGFAVVASEVKALAAQTAKATDEIASQISDMQIATAESVAVIQEVGGTIGQIAQIAASIAAAVDEQRAAIGEVARNVQAAAKDTAAVTANIGDVDHGAAETGTASNQMLASARSLAGETHHLKLEVGRFLATVRAA